MEAELSWGKVAGKYHARARAILQSDSEMVCVVIMQLVDEGFRALHMYFLAVAHAKTPWEGEHQPPIASMCNPRSSIVVVVLQYWSCLMSGKSPRLAMLLMYRRCESVHEWFHAWPSDVLQLRRATSCAIGSVVRRLLLLYEKDSWRLFLLGDRRLSKWSMWIVARDSCVQARGHAACRLAWLATFAASWTSCQPWQ